MAIADNLPPLRSPISGGDQSTIDPTLIPYLQLGLQAAEQQYLRTTPQFFPGQTYIAPSEQTMAALQEQERIAGQPSATLQGAQQAYLSGLGGLAKTAYSPYEASPYLGSAIESATRPLMQQFEQTTLPGVASLYSKAGRYGSGAMERSVGQATEATGRAIGDVSSNLAYQDYSNALARQQAAQGALLQGATLAPSIYAQQFLPSQQLAQVGAAREAIAAQPLQQEMSKFYFEQQAPIEQLTGYLSSIYGTPMGRSQAAAPQVQTNQFGQILGGALTGYGIGSQFGYGGYGALAGGLLGSFF